MGASDLFYTVVEFLKKSAKKTGTVFSAAAFFVRRFTRGGLRETLRRLNVYRRAREYLNLSYLGRIVEIEKKEIVISWQPALYVLLKIGAASCIGAAFFGLYPNVAVWVKWLIGFFRLNEIYNFGMPGQGMLENIGQIILLIPIGYAGIWFSWYQFIALFSSFVVSAKGKKAYYIKNLFLKKELYIFSIPEIEHFILKQNILGRLFGIGTVELRKKSGETVRIGSLKNVSSVMKKLSLITSREAVRT